jgi:penicillin-binding protein 1A
MTIRLGKHRNRKKELNNSTNPARRIPRLFHRIGGYFRTLVDPASRLSARIAAGLKVLAALGMAGVILLCLYAVALIPFTPSIADLSKAKVEQPSVLISVDGQRLATYKRFNREWVPLDRISPHVVNALIATEDHRFYQHHGIDFYRTAGAVARTLAGRVQGGSTLTQQLARNLYPEEIGRRRSINRKIKETITALKIEQAYTKREILETYLNTVPFLYNAFGIEMAARTYFDKPAAKLSLLESATLVGMLKGASYYNPVSNAERATARRNVVMAQMVKRGTLEQTTFESLRSRPIRLDFERQLEARGAAPHFAEHIRKWLIEWADRNNYNIYSDGLKVYTTIDSRLQAAANQAVRRQMDSLQAVADVEWGISTDRLLSPNAARYAAMRRVISPFGHFWKTKSTLVDAFIRESVAFRNAVASGAEPETALASLRQDPQFIAKLRSEKTRLEAGLVALDPATGDVKAWVGSRDFDTDQYDHVARAQRQPGSTFKPFVYGAALEQGMSPDEPFIDRVAEIRLSDGSIWRPRDIAPPSGRQMTAREGLVYSKNTITAQVMQQVGPRKVADFAQRTGIRNSKLDPVPSLALGTSPASLMEMATAYGTIANGGEYRKPILVTRVEDSGGRVLVVFSTRADRVLSRQTAEELVGMMRGAVNHGTGQAIRKQFGIQADVAGKTGTTQDNADGWFILMHPRLVTGAWVGFNDARVTMRSNHWGQGAHNALPVVGDFFRQVLNRRMIDTQAQFPRARDAMPGASVWGPVLDWFDKLFGRQNPSSVPPPDKQSEQKDGQDRGDSPLDVLEGLLRQARRVEKAVEGMRKIFE